MTIHQNSREAFHQEKPRFPNRKEQIMEIFLPSGAILSDRQVKDILGYSDMNAVRPRITELCKEGRLEEVGAKVDPVTNKKVRCVGLPMGQMEMKL